MAAIGAALVWRLSEETHEVGRLKEAVKRDQARTVELESSNQELAHQLSGLQSERKSFGERLASLNTQLVSATSDLEQSRVSLEESKHRNDALAQERAQLQEQLTEAISGRDQLTQQLQHLTQENRALQQAAGRVRDRMALLERGAQRLASQLAEEQAAPTANQSMVGTTASVDPSAVTAPPTNIPGTFELPPIVIREDRGTAASVRGRLVEVNGPQDFVVVDKGSDEGVRAGMTFDLHRGTRVVGRATAIRVRPHFSACEILHAQTPGPLQVGDVAVQRGL